MLSKVQRLSRSQFEHYFKSGKRSHSPHLQLIVSPSEQFHGAVVVGKKVFKRATDRNQLRRRLYGVLYRFHTQTNATGVFVVVAKPSIKTLSRQQVLVEMEGLLGRLGALDT